MDQMKYSTLAHRHHLYCNPIGQEKMDRVLTVLDPAPGACVLDIGCGKAEILIRLIELYRVTATGVDINPAFLAEARERASVRVRDGALTLHEVPAREFKAEPASFDLGLCIGSSHALGDFRESLATLAVLVKPGGYLVIGEGYWKTEPDPVYLAAIGAERSDYLDHAGNVRLGMDEGLTPHYACVSSEDEWDHYEGLYAATVERHVAAHPDDPDAGEMRDRIRSWRESYLRWGRATLGFGVYVFRR